VNIMKEFIVFTSLGMLVGIALFLCLWCKYNDGIVGKISLGAIALGGAIIIIEAATGMRTYEMHGEYMLLLGGLAVFWLRHVARRVNRFRKSMPARRVEDRT